MFSCVYIRFVGNSFAYKFCFCYISVSEAGSDIGAPSPGGAGGCNLSAIKEEPVGAVGLDQLSGHPGPLPGGQMPPKQHRRPKSRPSKYSAQSQAPGVHDALSFALKPPPCIVTIRRKTKNLRKHFRNPGRLLQMGAAMQALIRFESQVHAFENTYFAFDCGNEGIWWSIAQRVTL